MTFYNLAEFQLRQSRRNQSLPSDFPPTIGEGPMEAIDQGATIDSRIGEYPVVESGDRFAYYVTPLVQ